MATAWTTFYWRDYLGDTGHLTLQEHGAYLLLMAHYYSTGRPLPANAEQLHRICRAFAVQEQCAVDSVLQKFFALDGDVWRHARIDAEMCKAIEISEKRAFAARKAHKSRNSGANAEQLQSKCNANAMQMQSNCSALSQSQSQSHKEKKEKQRACAQVSPERLADVGLTSESWQLFVDHRRQIRKPLTDRAAELLLKDLKAWREGGHDPNALIETSVKNGWQGVFLPKDKPSGASKHGGFAQRDYRAGATDPASIGWLADGDAPV